MIFFYNDRPCNKFISGNKLKCVVSERYENKYIPIIVDAIIDNPKSIMVACYYITKKRCLGNFPYVHIKTIKYKNPCGNITSGFVDPWAIIYGNETICKKCLWYNIVK